MGKKLLADIFNANWALWQDIVFIVLLGVIVLAVLYIVVLLITRNGRMDADGERMAKKVSRYEERLEAKRLLLDAERAKSEKELRASKRELHEKEAAAAEAEAKAAATRQRLQEQEQKIRELLANVEMSKKALAEYQKREGTNVSEDIAVNALTDKALRESKLETDPQYGDCVVPLSKTMAFTAADVSAYLRKMPQIEYTEGAGQKPDSYKVSGKTFALVYAPGGDKTRVTFKCGPAYGAKLKRHLKDNVSNAKFPYGLLWFSVTNEAEPCSLELIKLLVDISFKISKLGY